jgi:methionyl aminopeptidase
MISGAVAGLVAITPAAGFVDPSGAIVIGFVSGAVCYSGAVWLKHKLGYDDSLDAFGVHGIGGARRLAYGDIVKLDVGVNKNGWIGDNATTIRVGVVPPKVDRLVEDTARILRDVIPHVTQGRRVGDISSFIEQAALARGYSVVREFVGHGVGRKLHEDPQIPNYGKPGRGPKLKAGMTLAIEPMINMGASGVRVLDDKWTVVTADGLPSAHFEHTVLVTKDEPEVLTWRKKTLLK